MSKKRKQTIYTNIVVHLLASVFFAIILVIMLGILFKLVEWIF